MRSALLGFEEGDRIKSTPDYDRCFHDMFEGTVIRIVQMKEKGSDLIFYQDSLGQKRWIDESWLEKVNINSPIISEAERIIRGSNA
jgi:hypothetical protein